MPKFQKKYNSDEAASVFRKEGCELLDAYADMVTPMKYRCACGNISMIRMFSFLKGSRCKSCGLLKMKETKRNSLKTVTEKFAEAGYKVIEAEYHGNKIPIKYICDRGHISSNSYSNFCKGRRCKQCSVENMTGPNSPNFDPDRNAVATRAKFRSVCRSLVRRTLKSLGTEKVKKSEELLGYSHQELHEHLHAHPNMKDIEGKWVVDHLFPIKAFLDYGIEDLSLINCLDNLQPLAEVDNLRKNARYSRPDFERFLASKGIVHGT